MLLFIEKIASWIDKLVSIVILLVTLRLVLYMLTSLWAVVQNFIAGDIWLYDHDSEILDWIVIYIVLVKAYKVLISYTKYQHISIRYVTELVIITCFVEFIFERDITDMFRIILGIVGLGSLFLFLYFQETIKKLDDKH